MNPKPDAKPENRPEPLPEQNCTVTEGALPGSCAPMVYPFIAMQERSTSRYDAGEALRSGTLFPGLDLPFRVQMQTRFPDIPAAMAELMGLDFALDELGLYLDTHPDDREALELFQSYSALARQGREKYESLYGPLERRSVAADGTYTWIRNPWPWEGGKQ